MDLELKKRIAFMALALFSALAACMTIAYFFGVSFYFDNDREMNQFIGFIVNFTTYMISSSFALAYFMDIPIKDSVKPIVTLAIFVLIMYLFSILFYFIGAVSIVVVLQFAIAYIALPIVTIYFGKIYGKLKTTLVYAIIWTVPTILFQALMTLTRTDNEFSFLHSTNYTSQIFLSTEIVIVSILFYLIGGKLIYANISKFTMDIFSRRNSRGACREDTNQGNEDSRKNKELHSESLNQLKKWALSRPWRRDRFLIDIIKLSIQVFVLFATFLLCVLGGVLIEGIIIFISFFVTSHFVIGKSWHAKTVLKCAGITIAAFYGMARFVPSFSKLWFACIIGGVAISVISFKFKIYDDSAKENAKFREDIDNMISSFRLGLDKDKDKLMAIARLKGLDCIESEILVSEYIDGLKPSQLHAKFNMNGGARCIDKIRKSAKSKFLANG